MRRIRTMQMSVMQSHRRDEEPGTVSLRLRAQRARGFTLIELLVAMGIAFTVLAGLAFGYIQAYRITDSSLLQAAAQRLATDRLEMVRLGRWQHYGAQPTNQLSSYVGTTVTSLQVPSVTSSQILASVVTQVSSLGANPPLTLIQVQCIWTDPNGFNYTSEVATVRAPD